MNGKLDGTDLSIVEVLRTNPRITNKDIAERLDIAESTVAQRIRGMAERDVSMDGVREVDAQILVANIKHGYYLSHFEAAEQVPRRK